MSTRSITALAACLFAALALAACGGGGNDDADQITEQIDFAATSGDPTACTDAQTLKFTEQTTFESGQAAIASCMKNASSTSDSVDVSDIVVDGDRATATVAVTGSTYDGQTLEMSLVKEDGLWKVDSIDGFRDFDAAKFAAAFAAEVAKSGDLTAAQAKCVSENLTSGGAETIKQALLSGDTAKLSSVFGGC